MKFRKKNAIIEATPWFKDTDHPEVRSYPKPSDDGRRRCERCEKLWRDHGWIAFEEDGGYRVCPGDWVITDENNYTYPCKPDIFEATYDLVDDAPREDDITIDLTGCARCHADHPRITFRKLTYPLENVSAPDGVKPTHWVSCPTNGEPILLSTRPRQAYAVEDGRPIW